MLHYYKLIFYSEHFDLWKGSVTLLSANTFFFFFFGREKKSIVTRENFLALRTGEEKLMRYIFFFSLKNALVNEN